MSTLVAFCATELDVFWTGWAEERRASVVFIAPAGQKVYLTAHRDQHGALVIDQLDSSDEHYRQRLQQLLAASQ